jgi:D-alanyl-D-alanine carboxypeptidase
MKFIQHLRFIMGGLIFLTTHSSCQKDDNLNPITSIKEFIKNNPNRSSFLLIRNDSIKIQLRQDQKFPLASTAKIMVAIEFAKQVAAGKINPSEMIDIADLDLYYLINTDADAHPNWKQNAMSRNELVNHQVSLLEVAKGMIWFSSNANTEYLMDRLGLENINANLEELDLPHHDKLVPLVSSAYFYSTNNKLDFIQKTASYTVQDFEKEYNIIHNNLKADKDGSYKAQFIFPDEELQKIWSDRLTASTTKEYASIMQKILSQKYYSPAVHQQLDLILQPILALDATNRGTYDYLYSKGGSTRFVLTYAVGAKTKKGAKTVMTVFFTDLTSQEQEQLSRLWNTFLIDCTQGERYKSVIAGL